MLKVLFCALSIVLVINPIKAQEIEIPFIDYVFVDTLTNLPEIKWTQKNPELVDGYIIKRLIVDGTGVVNNTYNTIATINNPLQFNYTDISTDFSTIANTNLRSESYRVVAYKVVDGIIKYSNMSTIHKTLYANGMYNNCLGLLTINYSVYNNKPVTKYILYYKSVTDSYFKPISENNINDTVFALPDFINADDSLMVAAVFDNNQQSFSNKIVKGTSGLTVPEHFEIGFSGFLSNTVITLQINLQLNTSIVKAALVRTNSVTFKADTIAYFNSGLINTTYNDTILSSTSYFYELMAYGTCGNVVFKSEKVMPVFLQSVLVSDFESQLNWNFYQSDNDSVLAYKIYRFSDFEQQESILTDQLAVNSYTHIFSSDMESGHLYSGTFCYQVEAVLNSGLRSFSNKSCINRPELIWVPNAINPKSEYEQNRFFKPVIQYVKNYSLFIYSRYGYVVYQSENSNEAWHGTDKNGQLLPSGTYTYLLQYVNSSGRKKEKAGYVNLIY